MILLTIDELQEAEIKEIEEATGKKVFLLQDYDTIPYEEIEIMISYGLKENWKALDLDRMKNLKWVQIFQTGIEQVPLKEIERRGIKLTNVKDIYGQPMSEYALSLILYELKDIERFIENKKRKKYDRKELLDEAGKKTIGIFGTGVIGQEVAKKAKAFDMEVFGFNSNGRPIENFDKTFTWDQKEELLRRSDFIVLLLPLIDKTYHFLGEREFKIMKDSAYVINIGRGPLINEDALLAALKEKQIKGAALDVFYEEPLPESSPLWEAENLILTPHLSGKTKYFFQRTIAIFKDHYASFKENQPMKYEIDFEKGY